MATILRSASLIASQVSIANGHGRFHDIALAGVILDRSIHKAYRILYKENYKEK